MEFLTLDEVELNNKRVLIREDFNVPILRGEVESDLRIRASLPGIKQALDANAKVILMSHLGRPAPNIWQPKYSLQPVASVLQKLLRLSVHFVQHNMFDRKTYDNGEVFLLENLRFLPGETENDPDLAKKMADLCDVFVMDAFGSAHRAHASTVGVAEFAAQAVGGPLLVQEIVALNQVMHNEKRPITAIVGGAKISTKLPILSSLVNKVNVLIIGGGMANTLLAAQGHRVGESLYEAELIGSAQEFLMLAKHSGCELLLPTDVVVQNGETKALSAIQANDKIFDIGAKTIELYSQYIMRSATILWNGPLGVFEDPKFATGTQKVAEAIAKSDAFSVAGGGDTVAALENFNLAKKISYISTGGGAFLEYIEGKPMPAIEALIKRKNRD